MINLCFDASQCVNCSERDNCTAPLDGHKGK